MKPPNATIIAPVHVMTYNSDVACGRWKNHTNSSWFTTQNQLKPQVSHGFLASNANVTTN